MTQLPLAEWRDFYAMIGTASGAIVGAAFIVASLASNVKERSVGMRGFITPNAVNLGSVLVVSAILTAPTLTLFSLTVLLGLGGVAGAVYGVVVATRIWHMPLDLSDRFFYVVMPISCFSAIAGAAVLARWAIDPAFEIVAVALVLLLIVGMRNAWDMASFIITRDRQE